MIGLKLEAIYLDLLLFLVPYHIPKFCVVKYHYAKKKHIM
jgi:hypothetical protein